MSRAPQWVRVSWTDLAVRYRSLSVGARAALWDLLAEQQANGFVGEALAQVPARVRPELEPFFPIVSPGRRAAEWLDIELRDAAARAERGAVLAAHRWRPGTPVPPEVAPQAPGLAGILSVDGRAARHEPTPAAGTAAQSRRGRTRSIPL